MDGRDHALALPSDEAAGLEQAVRVFVVIFLAGDEGVDADLMGRMDDLSFSDIDADVSYPFLFHHGLRCAEEYEVSRLEMLDSFSHFAI